MIRPARARLYAYFSIWLLLAALLTIPVLAWPQDSIRLPDGYSVLRPMPAQDVPRAAQILAAYSDSAALGIRPDGVSGYWLAKTTDAQRSGLALCLYVNTGSCAGAVIANRDDMDAGRAVLWGAESMWDPSMVKPAMLEAAQTWARNRGLSLGEFRRAWVPLGTK